MVLHNQISFTLDHIDLFSAMTFFDNFKSFQLIAAHRGFRALYPENTLSAFRASIGHCHFIELDIQMSKDLVPVVFHDSTLERTSNAEIQRKKMGLQSLNINDWTMLQLKTLDIGTWFLNTDPFGTILRKETSLEQLRKVMPQTVMTLEEVLLHPALQKIPINIEIKDHRGKEQHKTGEHQERNQRAATERWYIQVLWQRRLPAEDDQQQACQYQ